MSEGENKSHYTVVGYLAREHGLQGLQWLLQSERYRVGCVFTHRRLPKSEDPQRLERPEFQRYKKLCQEHGVLLWPVDAASHIQQIGAALGEISVDLNASISWRLRIPTEHLAVAKMGGVNLHRGALPQYAGAEPVKRMLLDRVPAASISAHVLAAEIDAGEVLQEITHPIRYDNGLALDDHVEKIKRELTPYFGPLLLDALDKMVERYEQKRR